DRLAGAHVLLAELGDDLGARGGDVAEDLATDLLLERLDDLGREAVRVEREGFGQDDPGHLPVSGRRVLARRAFGEPAVRGSGFGARLDTLDPRQHPEPEPAEVRRVDPADGGGRVAERVRTLVAVRLRVGRAADPERVADEDQDARDLRRVPGVGPHLSGPRQGERSRSTGPPTAAPRGPRSRSGCRTARTRRRWRAPSSSARGSPTAGWLGAPSSPRAAGRA